MLPSNPESDDDNKDAGDDKTERFMTGEILTPGSDELVEYSVRYEEQH